MHAKESPPVQAREGRRWWGSLRKVMRVLVPVGQAVLICWASLAIYYSNLPWPSMRLVLAVVFAAFSIWALWLTSQRWTRFLFRVLFLGVVIWEISIMPLQQRQWRAEVEVLPRAFIAGDNVRITGVRDFSYRSAYDFDVRHVQREVLLSRLRSVDLFISYWVEGPVAHTFLSFHFDDAAPLAISIETRPEVGEGFDPLASLFKQFELVYIVGEERDLVGVRTNYRREAVYLYPLRATPEGTRRLFLAYLGRINELADRPEWYHLLKSNCTVNVVRYARGAGHARSFDLRYYLNGWVDRYLHDAGLLAPGLPFEVLRARARIRESPAAEDPMVFSRRLRVSLPSGEPPSGI